MPTGYRWVPAAIAPPSEQESELQRRVPAAPVVATTPPPPQIRNPGPDPWSEEIVIE